jgi:predicted transcriptional regulator
MTSSYRLVLSNVQGQDTTVRTVTTHLVRRTGIESRQEKEIYFFAKFTKRALLSNMNFKLQLRIISGGIAAGVLCLPFQSVIEGKNKQI